MQSVLNIFMISKDRALARMVHESIGFLRARLWETASSRDFFRVLEQDLPSILLFIIEIEGGSSNGHNIVRQIVELDRYRNIPLLFISSREFGRELFLKIPGPAYCEYDFILKPLDGGELKTRVAKLIQQHTRFINFSSTIENARETRKALLELSSDKIKDMQQKAKKKEFVFNDMLRTIGDMSQLRPENLVCSFLLTAIGTIMASSASVFIRTNEKKSMFILREQRGRSVVFSRKITLDGNSHILKMVKPGSGPVRVTGEIFDQLKEMDKTILEQTGADLIVPIVFKNDLSGLLFLGSKMGKKEYTDRDIVQITTLCNHFAGSFEMNRLNEVRSTLSHYVPGPMIDYLMDNPQLLKLGGIKRNVVVMFADIRHFTEFAEKHDPEKVVNILNTYFSFISQVIYENGGMLDKYIGDCIMVEFGLPLGRFDDVERAARTAIEIQRQIKELNIEMKSSQDITIEMGIALHYGEVISGNLGSVTRMDYTVIGDTVNAAARIEEIAEPGQILVSKEFLEPIQGFVNASFSTETYLRGKMKKIELYELHGFVDEEVFAYLKKEEPYRVNHFTEVSNLNTLAGKKLGYSDDELRDLKLASLLLDIGRAKFGGKMFSSDKKFTEKELEEIRKIPVLNRKILAGKGAFSDKVLDLTVHFHENFDGTGYPDGLGGKQISEWARICRISDTYVAMTSLRPYRKPLSKDAAVRELQYGSGKFFDPSILHVFLEILEEK